MHHYFLDKYAALNSIIHHLDPRLKIIIFFSYVLFVVLTPPTEFIKFFLYFLLLFSVIELSKLPLKFILKRSAVIIPFVLMAALFIPFLKEGEIAGSYSYGNLNFAVTYSGLLILFNVLVKSWLSVISMITLTSTTKFADLLKAFEYLKFPKVMLLVISFMYRYIFVIADESMRLKTAGDARNFGNLKLKKRIEIFGNIIAMLFIRSYERAERVYAAMLSRGFDGNFRTIKEFKFFDIDFVFAIIIYSILIGIFVI
ncbi:Cobalt ABC transporter permease component [groundwater metagenome]|uniref:Cobalt ABC transporter permease component n=1 Tax=groundwater metagenome TaxID=717931 RepID=A0A098EAV2_9ZZZZ